MPTGAADSAQRRIDSACRAARPTARARRIASGVQAAGAATARRVRRAPAATDAGGRPAPTTFGGAGPGRYRPPKRSPSSAWSPTPGVRDGSVPSSSPRSRAFGLDARDHRDAGVELLSQWIEGGQALVPATARRRARGRRVPGAAEPAGLGDAAAGAIPGAAPGRRPTGRWRCSGPIRATRRARWSRRRRGRAQRSQPELARAVVDHLDGNHAEAARQAVALEGLLRGVRPRTWSLASPAINCCGRATPPPRFRGTRDSSSRPTAPRSEPCFAP